MGAQGCRLGLAVQHRVQQAGAMTPGFAHVDMEIGFVAHHDQRLRHHHGRHHCVQVKRDLNRHIRANNRAQAVEQFTLFTLAKHRHQSKVQAKEDGVQRITMHPRTVADQAHDMLKRVARRARAGGGVGGHGVGDLPAHSTTHLRKPGQSFVDVAKPVHRDLAQIQHAVAEVVEGGFTFLEGIAFMDESAVRT